MQQAQILSQNSRQLIETVKSQHNAKENEKAFLESREPLMDSLWERMVNTYGSQFTAGYGDVGGSGYGDWNLQLARFSPETIGKALDHCIDSDREYPPNLSVFKGFCKGAMKKNGSHNLYLPKPSEKYIGGTEHHRRSAIMKAELGL
jgi:hypothetical protein